MNPSQEIVLNVRAFLLTGHSAGLPSGEADCLQKWLDETNPEMQPPVLQGLPDQERLERIELLTAHYCRYRHNDWSEEFISDRAKSLSSPPYSLFVQDLTSLCKSHHFGMQELMSPTFDLRIVGSGNKLVNLRYLAAVLRVADVLEFDPERTPDVIFAHRAIPLSSKIFWYKDHSIVLGVSKVSSSVLITARTSDAWTHRAVLETANDVDAEFQICANIRDHGGFSRGVRLDTAEYYKWPWPPRSARDISPMPGTFEYIDGAFRPDNRRILGLLAGTQLYETPLAALRELLQNAFDAVKEQIAVELLRAPNAHDSEVQEARAKLHRVSLSLETWTDEKTRNNETRLVCTDTGVGMTRRIIERHLLVGGSRPRPELLQLQRLCREEGFNLNRSGEFGIGVLSYFMLADKMILETRSSPEAYADHEPHGWRFETEGLDAFGELKVAHGLPRGSTVKLRIAEGNVSALSVPQIEDYLKSILAWLPCELFVHVNSWSGRWGRGRTKSAAEFKSEIFVWEERNAYGSRELRSSFEKEREEFERTVYIDGLSKLRFHGPREGELPEKRGRYRIHLPYFELNEGPSLVCVALNSGDARERDIFWKPRNALRLSWRGFGVVNKADGRLDEDEEVVVTTSFPCLAEIDLWTGARIAVDRKTLTIDSKEIIEDFIADEGGKLFSDFVEVTRTNSRYCSLTQGWAELINHTKENNYRAFWLFNEISESNGRSVWRQARFPVLSGYLEGVKSDLDVVRPILIRIGRSVSEQLSPFPGLGASRMVLSGSDVSSCQPFLLYEDGEHRTIDDVPAVAFPPEWRNVLAVGDQSLFYCINRDHPTFGARGISLQRTMRYKIATIGEEGIFSGRQLQTTEDCAAWVLGAVAYRRNHWQALVDNFKSYLFEVFDKAKLFSTSESMMFLHLGSRGGDRYAVKISRTRVEFCELHEMQAALEFPKDPKWLA